MLRVAIASAGRFHAFDLARQIAQRRHLAKLYTGYPRWKVDGVPPDKVASFPWIVAPQMLLNQRGYARLARRLAWMAAETFDRWVVRRLTSCDVFHYLSSLGMKSQRVAKAYGALTVCDRGSTHILYQDAILMEEFARWGMTYVPFDPRIIQRELVEYEEADIIVVPSEFVAQTFVAHGIPPAKLVRIPYGVDLRMFRAESRKDGIFRVIYVGVLNLRKGIPYLLEAVGSLKLPDFEVWLVGPVNEDARPFLAKYDGSYQALGFVPRHELYKYYSQASVFVLASIEEGLATVLPQAMACGLPVIATTNTGAADLITHGVEGFILPIRDPEAIREKLIELYEDRELLAQMSRAARRRAEDLQGWDTYGEAMINCYLQHIA